MNGFYLALVGSILGAAVAFVVLRFLFSERLRKWSATNDKWTALETVVVGTRSGHIGVEVFTYIARSSENQRSSVGDLDSVVPHAALGVC